MPSFGTDRKKKPCRLTPSVRPSVSDTRVADPEIHPRPPPWSTEVAAAFSWLPARPTTPRTLGFDANDWATLTANAVSTPSCVSPWTIAIFRFAFAFNALKFLT